MARDYIEVNLRQGTPEWKKWRRGGFGASDIPVLMKDSPWKSVNSLLEEKRGYGSDFQNEAMRRGQKLEPEARKKYSKEVGIEFHPICVQHNEYFWARASLDGILNDRQYVVEIKCGDSAYKKARNGEVPQYYYGQLQHILFITGLELIDYWCYLTGEKGILLEVKRDDEYINNLIRVCENHKKHLIKDSFCTGDFDRE